MPSVKNKTSKFSQYMKSDKVSYVIYADRESLINKKPSSKSYQDGKVCYICGKRTLKMLKIKIIEKSEILSSLYRESI